MVAAGLLNYIDRVQARSSGLVTGAPAPAQGMCWAGPAQVLHARQLGINCIVVLEQYAELGVLLATAHKMGVRPAIGVRAKLSTHHTG